MALCDRSAVFDIGAMALPKCRCGAIAAGVKVRIFMMLAMALALLSAPLGMPAKASGHDAMAAAPVAHHGDMASPDHCDEQSQPDQPDRQGKADKSCCAAGCMAVAALPSPELEPAALPGLRERPAPDRIRLGHLGEIATPPPRPA